MNTRDIFVKDSNLPGCTVVIDKKAHFWYIVEKKSHAVLDYGNMSEGRRNAYISLSSNDCMASQAYARGNLDGSD